MFCATLDSRTSEICQEMDGKVFKISEGVPGINMPPLHPWCRSTTVPALDEEVIKDFKRRAKDPTTGKTQTVPANMTYEQWAQSLEENAEQGKKHITLTKSVDKIKVTSAPKTPTAPKSTVKKPQKSVKYVDNSAKSGIIRNEKNYKRFSLNEEETYEQWKDNYYAKNIPKITKRDKAALREYTDGSYNAINGVERYEKGSEAYKRLCRQYGVDNLDKYKKVSDAISSAVSKFDLDDDIITHRYVPKVDYITFAGATAKDLENAIGNEFTDKGFTSTCLFEHLTEKFGGETPIHLEIKIPKGTNGAYINEFSEKKNAEFEFLLNRGTKFKVLDGGERKVSVNKWITSERAWKDVEETEKYMILEVLK